ncbi:sensor histidine kinase [Luteimonas sp. A482]
MLTPVQGPAVDANQLRLYETILQAVPDLVYVFDLEHRFIYANQALLAMWGCTWEQARGKTLLEMGYEPWHASMHDEEIDRIIATRGTIRNDVPFEHASLGERVYDYIFMPVLDPQGQVEAIAGAARDVTTRKRQEESLRRSEERLSAMVNASSDLIYRVSPDWRQLAVVGGRAVGNFTRGQSLAWSFNLIHPEDRERVAEAIRHARETLTPYQSQHRIRLGEDRWAWVSSHAVPIRDDDGAVSEWFGAATDIDQRVRHEESLRLLVNELDHRVKNTLAIVQSIVAQTLRTSPDGAEATPLIESRLQALAATHDVLTREKWSGAPVEEIVRLAVGHCRDGNPARFDLQGPAVSLDPRRAVALSMAMHELCTNATKYGAMSVPDGRVRVHWALHDQDGQTRLVLDWEESGGPPVQAPTRGGFGTRLLQRGLQHDLQGTVTLEFPPAGVRCHIEAPLPCNAGIRP